MRSLEKLAAAVLLLAGFVAFASVSYGAVRFDVVGSPTEVINTGRSEVIGSINLFVRGTGNVTGTSTGGATQIGLIFSNPALQLDNTTASGLRLSASGGFAAASPSIVNVENREINGQCSGFLTINLLPGAPLAQGDFIRIDGVRGRIDASRAVTPGTDLFVDLQSINNPAANSFNPDRIRLAKSFDGMNVGLSSDGLSFTIRITEGFARAFVDSDSNNDGINVNDRSDTAGAALGAPTNSTQFVVRLDGIPEGVSGIEWPAVSTVSSAGAALHLLSSTFSGTTSSATYSYESNNQVGSSDVVLETFTLEPLFVFREGKCDTSSLSASVTLGPPVSAASGCTSPSPAAARPRFVEAYELSVLSLSPSSVVKGNGGFTLTVTGAGFVASSVVQWNGSNRPTTFVSSTQLTAAIPAGDVAQPGTANVTVVNPAFGGATSNVQTFTIKAPALTLFYPRFVTAEGSATGSDKSEFTGIALANVSGRTVNLTLTAYDKLGNRIAGANVSNPAAISLNGGGQLAMVDSQILGPGLLTNKIVGWLKLEGNVSEVTGFFLSFNGSLSVLDGARVSSNTLLSFILPEIEEGGFTQIHVANPNSDPASVTFEVLKADGTVRATAGRTINANGVVAEAMTELFPGVVPAGSDYIRGTATRGVVPLEYLGKDSRYVEALNGQDTAAGATTLYSPQFVVGGSEWGSLLSVVNLESTPGTVTLKFISDDGTQIGPSQVLTIPARGKIYITDQKFFGDESTSVRQGYVEVTSSGIKLAGSVVFGDPGRNTFSSALPLVSGLHSRMVFSHVASNTTYFTGISILNPNASPANAVIEVIDGNGNPIVAKSEEIPARGRKSRLLTEYFPSLAGETINSGYVRVTVNRNVASFALFGSNDLSVLSAVEPQTVP